MGDIKSLEAAKSKGIDLDSCDYDFRTALHLASAVGSMETVKWLLDNGAKVSVDRFGGLPIHDALRNNHVEIAAHL
jgi:ankyrin repeat protein